MTTNELFNFIQGSDITGESSFDIWKSLNPNGTEQEFLSSIRGQSAYDIWLQQPGNAGKTEEEFIGALNKIDPHLNDKNNPHGTQLTHFGITATATELNYMDGVTSNIQTQLNGKAASGHTHTASDVGAIPLELKGQAIYCDDLFATFEIPTLVYWGDNTKNTPHTAEFTQGAEGFAIVTGDFSGWHSVLAWQKGGDRAYMWMHTVDGGINHGWHDMTAYLPLSGGTISNTLTVKGDTNLESNVYVNGKLNVSVNHGSEGGEITLNASPDTPTQSGVILDQCNSRFRIFGIPSLDGTTRTGAGTPLVIDPYDKTIVGGYIFDGNATTATTLSSTLPMSKGGTGSTSRTEANQNLSFIGANPITSTANDTTANWAAQGTGHAFYSTNGYLNGQPSQYGLLVNFVYANEVFQLFNQQAYGGLNYRSGNSTGWDGASQTTNCWRKIYDTGNIQKGTWSITSGSTLATDYIYLQYE